MSDNNSNFDPNGWLERERAYRARAESLRPRNKAALFDVLARHGITAVTVEFDGYGDSGQIEDIDIRKADNVLGCVPTDSIDLLLASWNSTDIVHVSQSLREAIETLVYDFLGQTHAGWENNDGAYGNVRFDTERRMITLEYNERHMESDYHEHVF